VSANAGRSGRRWKRLRAEVKARRGPCYICRQPIDYGLEWPDPGSFSVEHIRSWHDYPHLREDPANLIAAHLGCNSSKQDRVMPTLGETSEAW
jgi:5-methylcytosine-specific restriction endonuclease McrA